MTGRKILFLRPAPIKWSWLDRWTESQHLSKIFQGANNDAARWSDGKETNAARAESPSVPLTLGGEPSATNFAPSNDHRDGDRLVVSLEPGSRSATRLRGTRCSLEKEHELFIGARIKWEERGRRDNDDLIAVYTTRYRAERESSFENFFAESSYTPRYTAPLYFFSTFRPFVLR